ncbi:MAG: hypothetical protein IJA34_06460 [Lachnospiraceae bacterium]|nr:hypothetical protein [Lachnospiraceae bacterium]
MRYFDDLKYNLGYYYVDEKFNINGEYKTYTSKFAVSNSEKDTLSSKLIMLFLYKDKFIITDFKEIHNEDLSSKNKDAIDKKI